MKSNSLILFLLSILFYSCNSKESKEVEKIQPEKKIEIYLTKNRVESDEGIPYHKIVKDTQIISQLKTRRIEKFLRIDTTNLKSLEFYSIPTDKLIFAGHFSPKQNDLEKEPFIREDEIIDFNIKESKIILSNSAAKKLTRFFPIGHFGKQFVITVDKTPIINGYFYSYPYSYFVNTNVIEYFPNSKELFLDKENGHSFDLRYGIKHIFPDLEKNKVIHDIIKEKKSKLK